MTIYKKYADEFVFTDRADKKTEEEKKDQARKEQQVKPH